jgi:hypothetical protein
MQRNISSELWHVEKLFLQVGHQSEIIFLKVSFHCVVTTLQTGIILVQSTVT